MNLLILSDDIEARNEIKSLMETSFPAITIVGEVTGIHNALTCLKDDKVDLLLADIDLEDGSVFLLLDRIAKVSFQTILLANTDHFAYQAIKYHATDYLLKPIGSKAFICALQRAESNYDSYTADASKKFEKIVIPSSEGLNFVPTKQIVYLEGDGHYSSIYLKGGQRFIASKGLKEYELILPPERFFRIHQSYLINIDRILKTLREDGGYVVMEGLKKIPIARRRKEDFFEKVIERFG